MLVGLSLAKGSIDLTKSGAGTSGTEFEKQNSVPAVLTRFSCYRMIMVELTWMAEAMLE